MGDHAIEDAGPQDTKDDQLLLDLRMETGRPEGDIIMMSSSYGFCFAMSPVDGML